MELKIMANQKKEQQLKLMKSQTFGVEVETTGADSSELIKYVADYFNMGHDSIVSERYDHDGNSLTSYYVRDSQGRKWSCMSDGSLSNSSTEFGTYGSSELVTPVLKWDDIETLQELIRQLKAKGIKSNARYGCGVHIHVGADYGKEGGQTVQSLKNLANLVNNHQRLLRMAINFTESRGRYCGLVCNGFIDRLNARSFDGTYQALERAWYVGWGGNVPTSAYHYHNSRYQMLNYHCLFNKILIGKSNQATTEFRCFEFHGDKMHAGELKAYIQLCLAMVAYSKSVAYVKREEIEIYNNPKNSMKNWLCNMGLSGDEFKTCRLMLTKRLKGDSACRNARPHVDIDEIDA